MEAVLTQINISISRLDTFKLSNLISIRKAKQNHYIKTKKYCRKRGRES